MTKRLRGRAGRPPRAQASAKALANIDTSKVNPREVLLAIAGERQRFQSVQDTINREIISDKERIRRLDENERLHQQRITQIDRQAQAQRLQLFDQGFHIMSGGFNNAITGMIFRGESFGEAMGQMALSVGEGFLNMGLQIVENWAEAQLMSLLIEKPADLSKITNASAVAAANAYAAYAEFPPVAAFMAANAQLATMSYAGLLLSGEGGIERVPHGGAMIRAHAEEMVLPARIANPLRSVVEHIGQSGGGGAAGAVGGQVHYHAHNHMPVWDGTHARHAMQRNDTKREMRRMLKDLVRNRRIA